MDDPQMQIQLDALNILPHYQGCELQGRHIPLIALYDDKSEWQMWLPHEGKPHLFKGIPSEGCYFATRPADKSDLHSAYVELMFQRALWPDIFPLVQAVYSDLNNLGASLAKIDLIFSNINAIGFGACRMVATELEYIFTVCRSLFDLLQETIANLWKRAQFTDPSIKKRSLPKSFQKMVYSGDVPVQPAEIARKWSVPPALAGAYFNYHQFFAWLREYRTYIEHGGKSFDLIFPTDHGFAVSIDTAPFSQMDIWCNENVNGAHKGSLRAAAALIVRFTLQALNDFGEYLKRTVTFPDEFAPGHKVFVCGPFINRITTVDELIRSEAWHEPIELDLVPKNLKSMDH